jgi:threonine/homoserine/homoserine lactone efflux protein
VTIYQAVLGFALVAGLLTVIPGLDTAQVLRSSLSRSRGHAFATASGVQTGTMVWGVAAAAGATALLGASELAYRVVSLAGAAYLIWMGVSLLVRSFRRSGDADADALEATQGGALRAWATGTVANLLNPKVGVFYIATIPQFVQHGVSPLAMGALLAAVHCALGMTWFSGIIFGASAVAPRLRSARFVRWLDRVTGGVLILFGAKLAVSARV